MHFLDIIVNVSEHYTLENSEFSQFPFSMKQGLCEIRDFDLYYYVLFNSRPIIQFVETSSLQFVFPNFLNTVFSDSDPESGDPRKSSFIAKQRRNAAGRTNSISVRQGGTPLNGVQLQRKSSSLKINGVNNIFHGT